MQKKDEMAAIRYTRTEAWTLLNTYTQSPGLLKHALAVEACTGAYGDQEAAIRGHSGMLTGAYGADYLDELRQEWPE